MPRLRFLRFFSKRWRGRLASAGVVVACCHGAVVAAAVEEGASVTNHCANFALAYEARHRIDLIANSVRTETAPAFMRWISNLFQPPGSRFTGGYHCRFAVRSSTGVREAISVDLYLAETLVFAEYTQWEELQIVPIERVVDPTNGRAGYGVFKYLRQK